MNICILCNNRYDIYCEFCEPKNYTRHVMSKNDNINNIDISDNIDLSDININNKVDGEIKYNDAIDPDMIIGTQIEPVIEPAIEPVIEPTMIISAQTEPTMIISAKTEPTMIISAQTEPAIEPAIEPTMIISAQTEPAIEPAI